jgi:hypothetical protein
MGHLIWTGIGIILAIIAIYSVIQVSKKSPHK